MRVHATTQHVSMTGETVVALREASPHGLVTVEIAFGDAKSLTAERLATVDLVSVGEIAVGDTIYLRGPLHAKSLQLYRLGNNELRYGHELSARDRLSATALPLARWQGVAESRGDVRVKVKTHGDFAGLNTPLFVTILCADRQPKRCVARKSDGGGA